MFQQPWMLILLPLVWLALWRWHCGVVSRLGITTIALRRHRLRVILNVSLATLLVLAGAGLQLPSWTQRTQLAIAADISPSISSIDAHAQAQNQVLESLLSGVSRQTTEAGVVLFSATAGTERPMSRLREPDDESVHTQGRRGAIKASATLPNLAQPSTLVDMRGTDIAAGLERCRSLFGENRSGARGILVLSDYRDTRGRAGSAAAALSGSGIDLLAAPAALSPSHDIRLAALRVPDHSRAGRAIPIEVTVAAQEPVEAEVSVSRRRVGQNPLFIDSRKIKLEAGDLTGGEIRRTVRIIDRSPDPAGVSTYVARVTPESGTVSGDISINNQLAAAVRIDGESLWAVLTHKDSTLAELCRREALGVKTRVLTPENFPHQSQSYADCEGILIDGLSFSDLNENALKAIADAAENGKGIVAVGGEAAFGAGGHLRDGPFEQLLPVYMTPEDDRTRSVLFIMDVSKSMDDPMGARFGRMRKIEYAGDQLAQAVQRLKEQDRLGLVTFSGEASVAAKLSSDPRRDEFLMAVRNAPLLSSTDMLKPIEKAREVLQEDDAEEQLVMLLSDGIKTVPVPDEKILEAARALCPPSKEEGKPRRTTLYTFGIAVNPNGQEDEGSRLMKALAGAGGGTFTADFTHLGEVVEKAFEQKKDFFMRREPFALQNTVDNPVTGPGPWPVLEFRNRVKARPGAETLLQASDAKSPKKSHPDPLVVLSGADWPGAARSAVIALSLDGPEGTRLLNTTAGERLLPSVLEWVEGKEQSGGNGWDVVTEPMGDDDLSVSVRASEPSSGAPLNGRNVQLTLTALQRAGSDAAMPAIEQSVPAAAPGLYHTRVSGAQQGIYHLTIKDGQRSVAERFVTVPYPAEFRRFGTDRAAMTDLVKLAGGRSRIINRPQDLAEWSEAASATRTATPLAPLLAAIALFIFVVDWFLRYLRPGRSS